MSEELLQIAEKRREVKGRREKRRYTQLNVEFQRISRRGKKAFLHERHKEKRGNNRMGKTSNLLKETGDAKGAFHAKMGTVKDEKWQGPNRSRRDLQEVARIHRRTDKKVLMTQITKMVWYSPNARHSGV